MQVMDLKDQRFGRLVAVKFAGYLPCGKQKKTLWLCKCDCGNSKTVAAGELRTEGTKSCGCLKQETARKNGRLSAKTLTGIPRTHGHNLGRKVSPELSSYKAAKNRSTNPNGQNWKDYGGRGIQFKFKNFQEFYAELGPRPEGYTVERIDKNGNYEKGNVRWATMKEQSNNRRPRSPNKKAA